MNTVKVVFFGTHEFAVTILQGLLTSPFVEVVHVITQPDEPVGRKQILTPPPVKILAEQQNIPVSQPGTLKSFDFGPLVSDINIVAQYGRIIPASIIEAPKYGTLNVHTSLLPKYRGASPIQTALLHGEIETGVTIMQMDAEMDTGPILLQKKITIDPDDTYLQLNDKLATLGSQALLEALPLYIDGTMKPVPQNNLEATYTKLLAREDGKIDWTKSADSIYNQYRGLTPWPGVWTMWNEKRLKLTKISPSVISSTAGKVFVQEGKLLVGCTEGSIELHSLQLEGKAEMDAKAFLNGYKNIVGENLK